MKHPDVQVKFFPGLTIRDLDRLRAHGSRVIIDIGIMIKYLQEGNNPKLVDKIVEVTIYFLFVSYFNML